MDNRSFLVGCRVVTVAFNVIARAQPKEFERYAKYGCMDGMVCLHNSCSTPLADDGQNYEPSRGVDQSENACDGVRVWSSNPQNCSIGNKLCCAFHGWITGEARVAVEQDRLPADDHVWDLRLGERLGQTLKQLGEH